MSWRYASSYVPRDTSGSRESTDSKYGVSSIASRFGTADRQSRWSKSNDTPKSTYGSLPTDRPPLYTSKSNLDGSSSVIQRLRERYSTPEPKSEKAIERKPAESIDIRTPKLYGRTTLKDDTKLSKSYDSEPKKDIGSYGSVICRLKSDKEDINSTYNRSPYRKRFEKSPEPEKAPTQSTYEYRTRKPEYTTQVSNNGYQDTRPKMYTSSSLGSAPSTTKYLGGLEATKKALEHPVTSPTSEKGPSRFDKTDKAEDSNMEEYVMVSMATRATSPTEPSASVYVRTRRADATKVIEKLVQKPKKRPPHSDKGIQTDKVEETTKPIDSLPRSRPWASALSSSSSSASSYSPSRYSSRLSSYTPREPVVSTSSLRSDYSSYTSRFRSGDSDYKRSISREEAPNVETVKSPTENKTIDLKLKEEEKITKNLKIEEETKALKPKSPEPKGLPPIKRPSTRLSSSSSGSPLKKSSTSSKVETTTDSDISSSEPKDKKSPSPTQFHISTESDSKSTSPKIKKSPSIKSLKAKEETPDPDSKIKRSPSAKSKESTPSSESDNKIKKSPSGSDPSKLKRSPSLKSKDTSLSEAFESDSKIRKSPSMKSKESSATDSSKIKKSPSMKSKESSPADSSESESKSAPSNIKKSPSMKPSVTKRSPSIPTLSAALANAADVANDSQANETSSLITALAQVLDKQEKPTQNGVMKPSSLTRLKSSVKIGEVSDSSASESSSEDESTSTDSEDADEELSEQIPAVTTSVKRSITNFLQNIPTILTKKPSTDSLHHSNDNQSRENLLLQKLGHVPKINFKRVESGERPWWLDSNENIPEGVQKIVSNRSVARLAELGSKQMSTEDWWSKINSDMENTAITVGKLCLGKQASSDDFWAKMNVDGDNNLIKNQSNNNLKLPPKIPSVSKLKIRQYSPDQDWLKGSQDSLAHKLSRNNSSISEENNYKHMNGDTFYIDNNSNIDVCKQNGINGDGDNNDCDNVSSDRFNNVKDNLLQEDDVDDTNCTPALRRWREQQQNTPYAFQPQEQDQMIIIDNNEQDGRKILEDFKMENTVKDITQLLANQNGIISPTEEKKIYLVEEGDMSGMINKAKAELLKSRTKNDLKKSSSGETSPIVEISKSEIEIYWKELMDSINRPLKLDDLDFTDLNSDDEADALGGPRINGDVPPPPPMFLNSLPHMPPNGLIAPPNGPIPPPRNFMPPPILPPPTPVPKNKKTVKLFWKEVKDDPIALHKFQNGTLTIWDELSSVEVDTQRLEHLFESRAKDLMTKKQQEQNKSKEVYVLDPKRSNAINIGMTKLPPPRAIKAAILKMDATVVNREGIEKLLGMLPTEEERLKIQDAQSANPDLPLGSAEQFLLTLASISELEARLKLWAFKLDYENSEKEIGEPLMDLKQGIEILKINKTFRCILSTLRAIGNFLNGYECKGFQIDYLSKVPEVKDTVHKHSLLHHLCHTVMEKFPESTDLYSEIGAVTRASRVDFDELAANIKKVEDDCKCSWNHLKVIAKHEGHSGIKLKMSDFLADCAERIIVLGIVHRRVIYRFHKFIFWLGIPINRISTTKPNEICRIISEFALEYRTTKERLSQQMKKLSREKSRIRNHVPVAETNGPVKKMNSRQVKEEAELRQLLGNDNKNLENSKTQSWRRTKKEPAHLAVNDVSNNHDNDSELLETLLKTANQIPSNRSTIHERRRSRMNK